MANRATSEANERRQSLAPDRIRAATEADQKNFVSRFINAEDMFVAIRNVPRESSTTFGLPLGVVPILGLLSSLTQDRGHRRRSDEQDL
jgi:hypothetical protein